MILFLIGSIASITSTISLLPQIYQTYKTKSAKDLSLAMLINFFICSTAWIAYGFLTETISVWLTNVIMTIFSVALIVMKIRYEEKPKNDEHLL